MFAIIKVINGNYFIHSEGFTAIESAIVQFHDLCKILWNAPDVINACVMIVDENLDRVDVYKEIIKKQAQA